MLKDGNFQSYNFSRHAIGDNDILIDIMPTGICHSDIHTTKGNGANVTPRLNCISPGIIFIPLALDESNSPTPY